MLIIESTPIQQYPTLRKCSNTTSNAALAGQSTPDAMSPTVDEYTCDLPDTVTSLDMPSRDLLGRLLHIDPHQRLRSLYSLERIAMYKGYAIADVRRRKVIEKAPYNVLPTVTK